MNVLQQIDPSISAAMQELAGDDDAFVAGLLATYVDQAEELLAQIRRAAHTLAGASLNIGADRIADLCRDIERGRIADLAAISDQIARIREAL